MLARDDLNLYVVADGAGGHNAGEVAAALAARSISNFMGATIRKAWSQPVVDALGFATGARRLAAAICKANHDVVEISRSHNQYQNMVATVVALELCARSNMAHVAYCGDARCYRLRAGQLEPLTYDHSLIMEVLEREPDLSDEIVARLPRNVVTRALGMEEHARVSFRSLAILPGDRYLLCSDGLSAMVEHGLLQSIMAEHLSPAETTAKLIARANEAGGRDNISVIVVDVAPAAATERSADEPTQPPPSSDSAPNVHVSDEALSDDEALLQRLSQIDSIPPGVIETVAGALKRKT